MGACLSLDHEDRKARARSEDIDRRLQYLANKDSGIVRILLLGAGESGKSTLVKQMKIIHSQGFTQEELASFRPQPGELHETGGELIPRHLLGQTTVMENLLSSMKYVLNGMGLLRINLDNPKYKLHAQTVLACQRCYDEDQIMLPFIFNALKCLWNDKGIRLAVSRGYEYELNDSAVYYFEQMDRICSEKFQPTQADVLRARIRTTSIIETCFKINGLIFRMFDVGGQRSERRKWIQCFDGVRALLFVAALSGYDMTLFEDPSVNRLEESLKLFHQIVNTKFFRDTSIILFLNKLDLFREKILTSGRHLRYYFSQFTGADYDVESSAIFIQMLFLRQVNNVGKVVYPHFTTATDTSNIQVVFQVVMHTITKENLEAAQLL